jgi:Fe-S oxidoreductase
MSRPDDRPLKRLPQLQARKATFEKCVFCPKLCRSACPVSNADQRETVTPWGKMSMSYFVANESVALAETFAAPAWACTGCFGCREHCDHRNDVTGTLFDSRSALMQAGVGPKSARRVLDRFTETSASVGKNARDLSVLSEVSADASTAVLVGCAYARKAPDVARAAVRSVAKLLGKSVSLVDVCCGAPLLYAGDKARFIQQGEMFEQAVKHKERVVVIDAGCASTLRVHHGYDGTRVEHFVELAARELGSLRRASTRSVGDGPVRWHDPCQLGRGLGLYDAPRTVLSRALGRAPDEFERQREDARCSGAGGLLPMTMPDVSKGIAKQRIEDHERSGGGVIVTGCASSKKRFEQEGARTVDLVTVVADALGIEG